ncbi:OmpA family protein [Flavobacterium rakeshii]|uniref:OmpA family protein n=1 Tax=Flavobacterium rakeshii TaxID=1038845 RepID=UPI002E7B9DE4|nr:OmpA family protein [Flavobacterium rakeshii]MEE1897518.1 OmpA family protein [Flavobacterium rakeshii]
MKNLYISLSFMLAAQFAMAQNKDTEKADKLFSRFEYIDAADEYMKLANKKDPYVYRQLAESYYNMFNSKEAIKWYEKAVKSKQDSEIYYHYAQMLKAEGRYEEANAQMLTFAKMAPKDQRAIIFMKDPDYLPKLKSQTKLFDEQYLDISDKKYTDFGAVLNDDKSFYFTSTRNTVRRKYGRNEEPYLDLYVATYQGDGKFSSPEPVTEINSKWHDGPATITADGNTMYFASESFKEGKFEKDNGQQTGLLYIFKATKVNGKWGNVEALPLNDKRWSSANPSVSADGKTLYFSSNRTGSMGETDIWKVDIKGPNSYGKPENMGPKVNTEGRESFPYITSDNKLFFSSEGRKGFGGYDVYMIDLNGDNEAINLGDPINTPKDDFSFTFNASQNVGFFASNRLGIDNLYMATPICGVEVIVTVRDKKTGKIIPAGKVAILDDRNNVIETRTADANGKVTYSVDCDTDYTVQASIEGYKTDNFPAEKKHGGEVAVMADLEPLDDLIVGDRVVLNSIYFEYDKSNITPQAAFELNKLVDVMKSYPEMVIEAQAHTDSRGSDDYNMKLSEQRAKSVMQYVVSQGISRERITGKGYGETMPKVNCGDNCTEEEHAKNRRNEFVIIKR